MYPGATTRITSAVVASAATISPVTDLILVSGSTALETIKPFFFNNEDGLLFVVPTDGAVATVTTGNIAVAVTMAQNRLTVFAYDKGTAKWYPGAIS